MSIAFLCRMSLYFAALNSGSNGNCFYVASDEDAVLIDAGLSCKETEKRMEQLGLSMKKIKAIFITHEHVDHIKGVDVLSRKYQLPVYVNKATATGSRFPIPSEHVRHLKDFTDVQIGTLLIQPLPKHHDAADPISFTVTSHSNRVGVFTDIGHACTNIKEHFSKCNIVFLEANYDEDMLENGPYPIHLKNRIRSDRGHLSNRQALELFNSYRSDKLTHLFLAHLSKENNHPDLLLDTFRPHAAGTEIHISSRYGPTALHGVDRNGQKKTASENLMQSTLF